MKNLKRKTVAAGIAAVFAGVLFTNNSFAATRDYIIQTNYEINSADTVELTFELQNIDGTVVSSKTSGPGLISFDPISVDDADTAPHFYKIVQKNDGKAGVVYDSKNVYARIIPSENRIAYQDDTTYKYVNDGSGPHPYNATDEELQGQAYAVYDSETKIMTFFRDEENKYTDGQVDGNKTYFTDFELANLGHADHFRAVIPSWQYAYAIRDAAEKIVFRDAIRPEGAMSNWFSGFSNVTEADIDKLDTSHATSLYYFFNNATKLKDIDITHLDFSKIVETTQNSDIHTLSTFLNGTSVEEFDSRNYVPIDAPTKRPTDAMLSQSAIRYLNTENFNIMSGSAEFAAAKCLERVVTGAGFTFLRTNLDLYDAQWLKIEDGRIGSFSSFMRDDGQGGTSSYGDTNPYAAGNYVRPTCNVTPATFTIKYTKPAQPDESGIKNPETNDDLTALNIAVISVAGLLVLALADKRVKN